MKVGHIFNSIVFVALVAGTAGAEGVGVKKLHVAESGRYQLFQGTYTAVDLRRQITQTQQAVFLIDTRSGRVMRYVNKIDPDGQYVEEWLPTQVTVEKKTRR